MIQLGAPQTKTVVDHNKITDMVAKMLMLGNILTVDNNKKVHYVGKSDESIMIPTSSGNGTKPLYVYGIDIKDPDAVILNPLSEGASVGKERLFMYSSLSHIAIQWLLQEVILYVEECAANLKNEGISDPTLIGKLSPFIHQVDEKMITEINFIKDSNLDGFGSIYYSKKNKTSTLLLGFEDEDDAYFKSFPKTKMRKKSWELFSTITKTILGVDSSKKVKEVYTFSTDKTDCPQFETFTNVWLKVWKHLAPLMSYFEGNEDPTELIDVLEEHFKYTPVYRLGVSWLRNSTNPVSASKLVVPGTTIDNKKVEVATSPSWKQATNNYSPTIASAVPVQIETRKPWQQTSPSNFVIRVNSNRW